MKTDQEKDTKNPSLYEDGKQLHKHATTPGYTMDPATQGIHGEGRQQANRARARSMRNMATGSRDTLWAAGVGLLALGAGFLAWSYCSNNGIGPFRTPSTNGAR